MDLHLDVPATRVRSGLEQALRDAVRTGRLHAGTRLPSSRVLAHDIGLARNTVAEAYGQLVAEGWLVARQGSGTRVADRVAATEDAASAAVIPAHPPRYDLRAGSPDLAAFPVTDWISALRRALATTPSIALGHSDPRGLPELREVLAGYLARARGVRAGPDRIVVCSGFTQGFGLLCRVLRAGGATTLAVESYGLAAHRDMAGSFGLGLRPLPVDAEGALIDRLGDETGALLTPAHQFPLGAPLAAARRSAVTRWAADTGGLVIEDDYDGEFRYDRHPVGAVQALAPDHVAYAGTVSQSLAPGIRLGWLVLPAGLVDDVVAAKSVAGIHSGTLDQLALAQLIASGAYDRHVRRSRLAYRRRRDRLVTALRRAAPAVGIVGVAAGLHLLATLPAPLTEAEVIERAARRGLALEGLAAYRAGSEEHPAALVVGYATPPEHAFTRAVARLVATLTDTQ